MAFDDDAKRAARDTFLKLGKSGTYTPAGGSAISTLIIVEDGVTQFPGEAQIVATGPRTVASVKVEDVPTHNRGDTIVIGAKTYKVDAPLVRDAYIAALLVR